MELIGKILDMSVSKAGEPCFILEVEGGQKAVPGLTEFLQAGTRLAVKLGKYRPKRSLDANAYHWVLCGKIADAIDSDADSVHYDLMVRYGTILRGDDGRAAIITVRADVEPKKCGVYARRIGTGHMGGQEYHHYALIKRSRDYDSKEMSVLIKGTVLEAQEVGVETLTPAELEDMMEALRKNEEKQADKSV